MALTPRRIAASGSLAWEPAGPRLAVMSPAGLLLHDPNHPDLDISVAPRGPRRAMAWSRDGKALALSAEGDQELSVVSAADGAIRWHIDPGDEADETCWSPDGNHLFALGHPSALCDAATGEIRWVHGRDRFRTITTIDASRGRVGARFESDPIWPRSACWSPDSRLLAIAWDDLFRVFDLAGRVLHEGPVAPSPEPAGAPGDGDDSRAAAKVIGAAHHLVWGRSGDTLFQEGANRLGRCSLVTHDPFARAFAFSPDGRFAAAEGREHVLHVRDLAGEQVQLTGHPRTITAIGWSPGGVLATSCRDGIVRRLTSLAGPLESWVDLGVGVEEFAWSADGQWLAVMTNRDTWVIPQFPGRCPFFRLATAG